ncbi:MAG: DUF167 domain-containing protein [Anaerolineales bacterium]|nr:DUF167 domain-containing protein [Anaerolineales bacterium]
MSTFSNARRGAAITVKVSPRAKKTEVAGVMDDGTLKIRLAAPPVDGAANQELIRFLAQALRLSPLQIDIIAGATAERKLISLVGINPREVDAVFQKLIAAAGRDKA